MRADIIAITNALRGARFSFSNERELQEGVGLLLESLNISFVREYELTPGDRIDFWLGNGVGVELKIKESLTSVTRQLHRYAQCEEVECLILVTTKMAHRKMPEMMNGKPICIVYLSPF